MKVRKINLIYLLYCLLVIAPIYQDSPLSKYLGAAGYTLMIPLSILVYFLIVFVSQNGKIRRSEETQGLFNLGKWLLLISAIGIVVWCLLGNSITVVGEFLPTKAIKVWLQYIAYPLYVYSLVFCIKRLKNIDQLFRPIFAALIILTVIDFIERTQVPYAFQGLHFAGMFPYYRIRLLTLESSATALLIYVYAGLTMYYGWAYKKWIVFIGTVACTSYLIFTTSAKSLIVAVGMVLLVYVCIAGKRLNTRTLVGLVVVAIAGIAFAETMLPSLVSSFNQDISMYTSVATRLYTSVIGLGVGVVFPFGVGGAVYLGVFQGALNKFLPQFQRLPIHFNVSEIVDLATRNYDTSLTVKSGILHFNMYWGILGTIYLLRIFHKASSQLNSKMIPNNEIIRSIFWTAILLLIFSSNFQFEFWLMYAIVCSMHSLSSENKTV